MNPFWLCKRIYYRLLWRDILDGKLTVRLKMKSIGMTPVLRKEIDSNHPNLREKVRKKNIWRMDLVNLAQ